MLGDAHTLFPDVRETLKAAERLVADGFQVMVYTSDDPIIAKELEQIGCVAIMPLASLIGSGMGILNPWNLKLIIEQAKVPVLVDAGVGTASDAAIAMELGCAGVLMNTAHRAGAGPGADGARDEARGRGRPRRIPRGPHAAQAVRGEPELADVRPDLMNERSHARARRADRARVRVRPLRHASQAAPPTPERVLELCAQVEGPSHCGRLVEAEQLKALPNLAARDGDTLRVTLFPSGTHVPSTRPSTRTNARYALWDYWSPHQRRRAVHHRSRRRCGFAAPAARDGRGPGLPAEPSLAPDRQRLAVADFCASRCDNEITVWRITREGLRKEARRRAARGMDRRDRGMEKLRRR